MAAGIHRGVREGIRHSVSGQVAGDRQGALDSRDATWVNAFVLLSDSLTVFRSVNRSSAAEAVRSQLEDAIRSGQLEVGSKLPPEHELARLMGVSRPVLREALGHLRAVGLIVSKNGRGSYVASGAGRPMLLGQYSLQELHEIRVSLEVHGARLAAERRSAKDLGRLRRAVEVLERCDEPEEWVQLDAAFHVVLAEATGNRLQALLVENLRTLLIEQSLVVASREGRIAEATREHRAIFDAVSASDPDAAPAAMSAHLINAYRD